MKRYFLYSLLLAGALAGCSGDELEGQGSALPEGEYPLRLSAEVGELQTRAGGKDTWTGDGTEYVGIRKGNDEVARYVIGENNLLNPASADQTLYWRNTAPAAIRAWYPYETQTNVDISDQSKGYAVFDFLYAEGEGSYNTTTTLRFKHQMAKVEYTLVKGDGISDTEWQAVTVKVYGDTQASFTEGTVAAADQTDGEITPNGTTSGSAVVVPQDMTGKPLLKVSTGGNDYIYTPETENAGKLEAGKRNTYNITVHKDRIEVSSVSGAWNDQETTSDATEAKNFRVYLPENHGQALTYSKNVTVHDNYLEVTGNSFSLSYTVTGQNWVKGFPIVEGLGKEECTLSGNNYTFTYSSLRSDVRLAYEDYIKLGDYYYSDGALSSDYNTDKTCIGIVFKIGAGEGDVVSNYGNKLTVIHGYVVALQDAHTDTGVWGTRGTDIQQLPNEGSFTGKYNGYTNTSIVRGLGDYNQYWAFQQVDTYQKTVSTPTNSSGWYLPSIGQLQDIYNLSDRATLFTSAGGADFKTSDEGRYWSSTEEKDTDAWYYRFNGSGADSYGKDYHIYNGEKMWCNPSYVRAVLTF